MVLTFQTYGDALWEKKGDLTSGTPITITSERVDFDNQKREALYSGSVKVIKDELIMTAEGIRVLFNTTGQGVQQINAHGHVQIWWNDRYAEAEQGVYDDSSQTIVLSGSPQSWQGENRVKGKVITYNLAEDKILVEGAVETLLHIGSEKAGVKNE